MIRPIAMAASAITLLAFTQSLSAQIASVEISWEVRNRFRLFAEEKDFLRAVDMHRDRSILEAEQAAGRADGEGWAKDVGRLCFNERTGLVRDDCVRDGQPDRYINPLFHRVSLHIDKWNGAECVWTFVVDGVAAQPVSKPCSEAVEHRFRYRKPNIARVDVRRDGSIAARGEISIDVKDLLIVGMGDSVGSGEGNPTRKVRLEATKGFCYLRVNSNETFFRPARDVDGLTRACPPQGPGNPDDPPAPDEGPIFEKAAAKWLHAPCHRSMYSYQFRAALARSIEDKHGAVTFVPLACSGATIREGILGSQPSRERPLIDGGRPPRDVQSQISALRSLVMPNGRVARLPDLILLTIGANDIGFSGLVADVMIEPGTKERGFLNFGRVIVTPDKSRRDLARVLPGAFADLRAALAPYVRNDMKRVIFTTYANPALASDSAACATGRRGFDVHPAFTVDGPRLATTSAYVENEFVPRLKRLVACEGGACAPSRSMTYVDTHRAAFAGRGFCATAADDPPFDRSCFLNGNSFREDASNNSSDDPLACKLGANTFAPYAPRARWVRTPNDGYFAAMTHPLSTPLKPSNLHDSLWGVSAALYGGAIHPTAEGHAAIAQAVLPHLQNVTPLRRSR